MHMSYWFGTDIGDFLFHGFTISSAPGFISICLGLLSLAVLFEALNLGLMATKQEAAISVVNLQDGDDPTCEASLLLDHNGHTLQCPPRSRFASRLYQVVFFVSRDVLSYTLMLAVMTFNGYFTISISLGAGIGFFLFSPFLMEIGLRHNGKRIPRAACRRCIAKLKHEAETEGRSNSSLSQGTDSISEAVTQSTSINADEGRGSGEEREAVNVSVVQIHSSGQDVVS